MLKNKYARKTFYLGAPDEVAIETIKERYGCSTSSDVIRLAVRLVAESPVAQVKKRKTA